MPVNKDFYTLAGSSGQSTGYTIDQSIRFNAENDAYMQRTHGAGGNVDKSTVSFWFKRATLGTEVTMFGTGSSTSNTFDIYFKTDNTMVIQNYASSYNLRLITNQVFRDLTAWYHVVFVYDSAQAVATSRAKLYINGQRVTSFGTQTYPSQNQDSILGTNVAIGFGRYISYGASNSDQYFPGYLAEMHYVNGYAYGPEYFGEFEDNGIWIPKEYTESYGTGGFFIDGRDSSDLGDDESGNGNDLSTNNLATTDQRTDSPTNNHATFNPLVNANAAYANGNVQTSISSAYGKAFMSFTLPNTGTWYWEGQEFNNVVDPATAVGIVDADVERLDDKAVGNRMSSPMGTFTGITVYSNTGQTNASYEYKNGSLTTTSGAVIISTSRLGFLWEPENSRFTIYDDGSQTQQFTSVNSGNYIFGVTMATGGAPLSFRLFVEANDWTQTPSGITSLNALNSKNIGS